MPPSEHDERNSTEQQHCYLTFTAVSFRSSLVAAARARSAAVKMSEVTRKLKHTVALLKEQNNKLEVRRGESLGNAEKAAKKRIKEALEHIEKITKRRKG